MRSIKRILPLLLSIPLLLNTSCSDEAQLAEQCETQSSCETTTETKTNWASAGGIGAGVVVLGALAGGGGSSGGGSSSSSSTDTTDSSNNNSGSTPTAPILLGRLLDSAVAGASYSSTSGLNGTTNANGEFSYREGDQVSFTIGSVLLGKANGSSIITPLELTGATTTADQRVVNLSRLLQTLDSDLEPTNGIFISSSFRNALQGRSFNFEQSPEVFASEANTTLSSAGTGRDLVAGKAALDHLHSTLQTEGRAS